MSPLEFVHICDIQDCAPNYSELNMSTIVDVGIQYNINKMRFYINQTTEYFRIQILFPVSVEKYLNLNENLRNNCDL